jgi:hypothetical protein
LELISEDWTPESIARVVSPLLSEFRASFADCGEYGEGRYAGNPWPWALRFSLEPRGLTVADALELGLAVRDLLVTMDSGTLDATTAWAIAQAGRVASLYGQPESAWLEAKTFGWDLKTLAGKIELAQDVARSPMATTTV